MPVASAEEQFKFLISCIRWSNNGKASSPYVNFAEVSNECGIVSKGAAAKRYERLMKTHGIEPNPGAVKVAPSPRGQGSLKRETSDNKSAAPASKIHKTKGKEFVEDSAVEEDQEEFENPNLNIKSDPSCEAGNAQVKEEVDRDNSNNTIDGVNDLTFISEAPNVGNNGINDMTYMPETPRISTMPIMTNSNMASNIGQPNFHQYGQNMYGGSYDASSMWAPANEYTTTSNLPDSFGMAEGEQFLGFDYNTTPMNPDNGQAPGSGNGEYYPILIHD